MEQRLEEGERGAEGETLASAALPLQLVGGRCDGGP
jgi:hypothetical protein